MAPRLPGFEGGDDVGHGLVGCYDAVGYAALVEEASNMLRGKARVARRIGARATDEIAEEVEEQLAVGLDPLQETLFHLVHGYPAERLARRFAVRRAAAGFFAAPRRRLSANPAKR